mmetsp:Transcript_23239/g.92195  ORF Transcript_23239/g.92195 Transcript_23239/m.92195 type:complete len:253 (+) Transcript_23239:869-1627(+)
MEQHLAEDARQLEIRVSMVLRRVRLLRLRRRRPLRHPVESQTIPRVLEDCASHETRAARVRGPPVQAERQLGARVQLGRRGLRAQSARAAAAHLGPRQTVLPTQAPRLLGGRHGRDVPQKVQPPRPRRRHQRRLRPRAVPPVLAGAPSQLSHPRRFESQGLVPRLLDRPQTRPRLLQRRHGLVPLHQAEAHGAHGHAPPSLPTSLAETGLRKDALRELRPVSRHPARWRAPGRTAAAAAPASEETMSAVMVP